MHKRYWGMSSVLMAAVLAVSSVNVGTLPVNAATEEAVVQTEETAESEQETAEKAESETKEEVKEEAEETKKEETKAEAPEEKKEEAAEEKVEEPKVEETKAEETKAEENKANESETVGTAEETKEAAEEAAPAAAEEEAETEGLEFRGRWNPNDVVKGKLTFSEIYQEYVYDLGEEIPTDEIEKISVKVKDQGGNLCIKFYASLSQQEEDFHEYNCNGKDEYSFTPNYDGAVRYVAVMSNDNADVYPLSVTVTDISVERKNAAGSEENTEAPVFMGRWDQSISAQGTLTFNAQYEEFVYDLGEDIPTDQVDKISVKVKDQGDNLCIKLYSELSEAGEKFQDYNANGSSEYSYTPDFDGTVRYVGIMSMAEGNYPYSVTVTSIKVNKKDGSSSEKNEYEETIVFEGDDLKFSNKNTGEDVEGQTLSYAEQWNEYWMSIGKTYAIDDIKEIKFYFTEATNILCFKLYDEQDTEVTQIYGQSGQSTYTYRPSSTGDACRIAIMAMNNQDEAFPFDVTVKKIELTVDNTPEALRPKKEVEQDIVDLRDPVTALMGDDFIIGTAASYDEFRDPLDMELATKHFNGVTLGNELKPESMLKANAEITTKVLDGEEIAFPVLDFSLPESRLDFFVDWNEQHPEKPIKIRGHVLVWHSQTPDFFFREDYDTSKPYVTPEVMNKRLEVYIREVAEHFTGEGSKYAGMFYGWDVVNEAVSDGTGTYRNASENSTWWRVYESPEFINNAFVYANKYMPADVDLFYNDYNETVTNKMEGICKLIENVKATPGARIDGMGMQAHYQVAANSPTMEQFKIAARRYAELVDQVQVTELDFKGAASATDEKLAERYKAVYDTIRRLRNEGVNFTGMTIWGITDKHSWLQTANNNGGGSNGSSRQYPLLFDDNYHAKNAFYALAEAGELEPEIRSITLVQKVNDDFSVGESYKVTGDDFDATFIPVWDENGITVKVTVNDSTVNETDGFMVLADDGTGELKYKKVTRDDSSDAITYTVTDTGYEAVVNLAVDQEALETNKVKMDFAASDNCKPVVFGDTTLVNSLPEKPEDMNKLDTKYFAVTVVKPLLAVASGSVVVDGKVDDAWNDVKAVPLTINLGSEVEASAKLLWDSKYLYVLADVKDAVLNKDSSDEYQQDSLEVFIDENNAKTSSYQDDDKQYRINYLNEHSFNGTKCIEDNVKSAAVLTEGGYQIEAAFKWTDITPKTGAQVGLELQINDANASGKRSGTLSWADNTGNGWSSTEVFGTIVLTGEAVDPVEEPATEEPATQEPAVEEPAETPAETPSEEPEAKTEEKTEEKTKPAEEKATSVETKEEAKTATATTPAESVKEKEENTLTVKGKTVAIKASKVSKKTQKIKISKLVKVSKAKGDVTYTKVSGNKKIKIDSETGKVTVKKGLKKGTYKVKVEVKAAGDDTHKEATTEVTFKIKVK
ncbi:endo-1,4-beta-xylanase [Butyrivibrio sp. INlla16]|uniref:endo-1,4-beta-xylanase n=1 Tax=Butyrivibrio sp. INlla16 TaxID=1520807 RepID=UPI0008854F00|nr:endo-1,4-beta-xylanase [Butyrivibrio sp. INlla16]SDB09990.1 endo-1,4-beta-xylanase [Butyrivibrio sp. INlla16]